MMSATPLAPPPVSPLARYRLLSPNAAVKVSPLCLSTMSFGNAWKDQMGDRSQREVEALLDYFYSQGGMRLVSDIKESEQWVGDWMRKRGVRDQMVIATKYTTNFVAGPAHPPIMANYAGNGTKSLVQSVESSLKNLQTSYIDVWDYSTSIAELMQSLNHLVAMGKVLYLGASNTPAWVVSKANEYARHHGLRQFAVYQGLWSANCRDLERDVVPMCKSEGMGITPWGAPGKGKFKLAERRRYEDGLHSNFNDPEVKICKTMEDLAFQLDTTLTCIALSYIIHKAPYVFPVIAAQGISHLKEYIQALVVKLDPENIKAVDSAIPFDLGFPHSLLWKNDIPETPQSVSFLEMAGTFDFVPEPAVPYHRANGQNRRI
uniref:NADP-dependent oxidoreductase domain-containing protein n=1 Tax=Bionectria ochroleuca TaxID=29856 RepID=A0A0B7JIA0_BIOOC